MTFDRHQQAGSGAEPRRAGQGPRQPQQRSLAAVGSNRTPLAGSPSGLTQRRACAPTQAPSTVGDKVAGLVVVATLSAGALLSGCKPAEPTQTVDFYKSHPEERRAKLKACGNNPGEEGDTPNCTNASQAEALSVIGTSK